MRASLVLLSSLLVCFAGSGRARADVLPPDGCTMPGQPCQNAGPSHNQRGLCSPSTCSKQLPSWDAPMSYPCSVCLVTDAGVSTGTGGTAGTAGSAGAGGTGAAGASGASGSPGTGGTTGPGGSPGTGGSTSHGGGSSGCSIAPASPSDHGAAILIVLFAAAVAAVRRRRHASR